PAHGGPRGGGRGRARLRSTAPPLVRDHAHAPHPDRQTGPRPAGRPPDHPRPRTAETAMTPARRLGLLTRHPQAVEGETHNPLIPPARRPRASGGAATGMLSALTVPTRRPQTVGG